MSNLSSVDRAGYPLPDPLVSKATISQLVSADLDLVEEMAAEKNRDALGTRQVAQEVADLADARWVEPVSRFVQD